MNQAELSAQMNLVYTALMAFFYNLFFLYEILKVHTLST
jgi:hypothetical protein